MKKVKVSKEQYTALSKLERGGMPLDILIYSKVTSGFSTTPFYSLLSMNHIDFINALQFGYEVEQPPEEWAIEQYKIACNKFDNPFISDGERGLQLGWRQAIYTMNEKFKLGLQLYNTKENKNE